MDVEVRTHTAIHIVKGAIYKVLGAQWSTSSGVDGAHGRIAVQFDRKPTEDEVRRIEELVNIMILKGQPIEILHMSREEAENRWGDLIYDVFPVPEHVTELRILHLPGWNVNTCSMEHTKTTKEIGKLRITKNRFRKNKQLLEISFDIVD